jgi:hypothetical protein
MTAVFTCLPSAFAYEKKLPEFRESMLIYRLGSTRVLLIGERSNQQQAPF